MNVISQFTVRSLKHNKKWTTVTILGLIISTAMLTAVSTFYSSFMALMVKDTISYSGNWHAQITGVSMEAVESIRKDATVKEAMIRRDLGYAPLQRSKNSGKPFLFIRELDSNGMKNFGVTLLSGRLPENGSEVALPEHLATNGGVNYSIGDTLTLSVGKRLAPDGKELGQSAAFYSPDENSGETGGESFIPQITKTYKVVGFIKRPGFEYSWSPGYTVICGLDSASSQPVDFLYQAKKINTDIFEDVQRLAKSLGVPSENIALNEDLLRYYGVVDNDNVREVIIGFLSVIVAIIIAASVSLIYNAFAISVSERTRQLGLLASVGATKAQKKLNVYLEGFLIAIIGIPLGILAGIAGIGITLQAIQPLLNSITSFSDNPFDLVVTPWSVILSAVLALFTVFISAWVPARRASKIMPIDAIRQSKEIKLSAKKVRTSRFTRALFGFEGEIALKNLKRSRKKYRVTVVSLIVSLVLFLTVSYYAELSGSATVLLTDGYNFDIAVSYSDVNPAEAASNNQRIAQINGVTKTTSSKEISGTTLLERTDITDQTAALFQDGEPIQIQTQILSLDDQSFNEYAAQLGLNAEDYRDPQNPKVIVMNQAKGILNSKYTTGNILTNLAGKSVRFEYQPSSTEEKPVDISLEIGTLTDIRPMGVLVQPFSNLVLITSETTLNTVAEKLPDTNWASYQYFYLNCENPENMEEDIRTQANQLSEGSANLMNIVTMTQSEQNAMLFIGIFVYGFIILISMICIANIANTTSTNMALRRKEFAMLRSVGMTPKSFNRMIRYESILYGLKALLYGLPISAGIALWLYSMQRDTFDFGFIVPWKSYLAAIVLIFIIVTVTMFYAIGKIKKENIIDALKMDNE